MTDEQVQSALTLIHDHPERHWTVATLAAQVGISRSAFAARFAAAVGRTPVDYLRERRMELAAQLLRDAAYGIKQIAARTGYRTPSALSNAFHRWAGMSPGEYRARNRQVAGNGQERMSNEG